MTFFFIQSPLISFDERDKKVQWSFEGSGVGEQIGRRRGTLIWLMVLNNSYKQLAGKVQHSSADTFLDYCKPQLL